MTIPGASAGSVSSTSRRDSVPPVEAPMQTMVSVVRAMAPTRGGGSMASAVSFRLGSSVGAGEGVRVRPTLAWAAPFTASQMRSRASAR